MSDKLKIVSTRFGELEVDPTTLIELPSGLIGFPEVRQFVLLEYTPPFSWLQSVESGDLAFVVVSASEFGEEYTFDLPTQDRSLDLNESDEVAIFNLVTIRPDPSLSTVNLKAPVVVNLRNRKGKQVILDDPRYPTRMPLYDQQAQGEEKPEEAK
jgi:flagellar assembly factor FliW